MLEKIQDRSIEEASDGLPGSESIQISVLLESAQKSALKRSKTMPVLPSSPSENILSWPSPPEQSPSPDVRSNGLDFPLPEPLSFPSISSTMMSSVLENRSAGSVPELTTSPTAASGLSVQTDEMQAVPAVHGKMRPLNSPHKTHENRQAFALVQPKGHYRSSIASMHSQEAVASVAYAANLNKATGPSFGRLLEEEDDVDLESLFRKLQASTDNLLNY